MTQAETLLDTLQNELMLVMQVSMRDLFKRLTSILPMLMICYMVSDPFLVFLLAAVILLTEVILRVCTSILPEHPSEISIALILVMWTTNSVSTFAYLAPAILLTMQPSVPLLLTGFVWVFGVSVYITNTFTALPYYNWSQLVPGFLVVVISMVTANQSGHVAGAAWEWWMAAGIMVIYGSNTVQTLIMQKATQTALNAARQEANARLAALEKLTRRDSLTGLLNRRAFEDKVAALIQSRAYGGQVAVFLIDLDRFKPINDSYSHDAGDQVLVTLAQRLTEAAGDIGVAARFGGDEFAFAKPGLRSAQEAEALGAALLASIEEPIVYEGRKLRVGASLGIGMTGMGNNQVDAICAAADQAMYRAKTDTGTKVILYHKEDFAPRVTLQDRACIIDALEKGQIGPHYQPKVNLRTGCLTGFEALARWDHPERGLLLPGRFLPQIDELGLQGDFLNHMAEAVLSDVTGLLAEGLNPGQVSINVPEVTLATYSGRQDLDRLLEKFAGAKPFITFEITEDVFITRAGDFIQESISHFRAQGVRISLDDFGTGFASFQHLRELEFDELKIDTSFVAGLGIDPSAEVLVEGFLSIAKGLGVDVIAEGVETDAQRNRLLELGAHFGQGWRFGRAIPLDEARVRMIAEQLSPPRIAG
ncbi:putative bifunctional diguanylate cyclase/phosphodiesterase [Flavimaricola marinus]|uniref:Phytochrome-like protein cph2 n=1 Tax=Flavimaricola marinus TaxID=1819565 RepID=A0A238LHV4_9RHOB|nr:EAL domain-containing protein [Flavimaricola marinus]SMY08975.1 Phytochrome-like protein cph2 [Flavimaricola marinus]